MLIKFQSRSAKYFHFFQLRRDKLKKDIIASIGVHENAARTNDPFACVSVDKSLEIYKMMFKEMGKDFDIIEEDLGKKKRFSIQT